MDYLTLFVFNLLPLFLLLALNSKLILTLKRVAAEDSKRKEEAALSQVGETQKGREP